jgi:diguanylate cyclase (GGDEF)-like protein
MASPFNASDRPKLVARFAVVGMSLAVLALGGLSVWSAIVTQNGAHGISRAGVQTSGHLRAIQALSLIDTTADEIEENVVANDREKLELRRAQLVLDDALARMKDGDVSDASRIANVAAPIVARLKPAIEHFLADGSGAEDELETILWELQVVLNDLDSDPSQLLASKLAGVTATERAVRATAVILIPLGLVGVVVCGWLLNLYRRRAEATMQAAIDTTAREARTDELTGLPNRRALLEELENRVERNQRFTVTLSDLNGFKRYNDTFGHPAGDALLKRLGRKLADACEGLGVAGRLGGDEFCVLFNEAVTVDAAHALLRVALGDEGEEFKITSSSGAAAVPGEAREPSAALRLADARMYAAKISMQASPELGMLGALTRMLDERHPGLGGHVEEVALLAGACAHQLGMAPDEVRLVQCAAELHDIGKVGIPTEILTKPGPLNTEEWEFLHRHSLIGERILAGIPSLDGVGALVRSSHERWDGRGYPDGLAGTDIPLGARIIAVADSYCAMTEDRPYAEARSVESTRLELRAGAGTQYDAAVVTAFLTVLDNRQAQSPAPRRAAGSVLALNGARASTP